MNATSSNVSRLLQSRRTLGLGLAALATGLLAGCATTGTKPDDMSTQAHHAHADTHEQQAADHAAKYDPKRKRVRGSGGGQRIPGTGEGPADYARGEYNPTERHAQAAKRHQKHAAAHREAAITLEKFEKAECGSFSPKTRSVCPFLAQVVAAENIENGVRVRFAPGTNVEAAAAHVRCHLAYARSQGREGMDFCPLYLRDVTSALSGVDTMDLTTEGKQRVEELRRRTVAHVAQ